MNKPYTIAIANQKGGVGKTTTAMSLAAGLIKKGKSVLCIDFDPQANLSEYLGYVPKEADSTITDLLQGIIMGKSIEAALTACIQHSPEGMDYIPSNILLSGADIFLSTAISRETVLKRIFKHEQVQKYDFILIDCNPSLGILLTNALTAANGVLIPVQAQKFAVDGLAALYNTIEMVRMNLNEGLKLIGVLATMVDKTTMSKSVVGLLENTALNELFAAHISRSVSAANSSNEQRSLIDANGKLGKEYMQVVEELLGRVK